MIRKKIILLILLLVYISCSDNKFIHDIPNEIKKDSQKEILNISNDKKTEFNFLTMSNQEIYDKIDEDEITKISLDNETISKMDLSKLVLFRSILNMYCNKEENREIKEIFNSKKWINKYDKKSFNVDQVLNTIDSNIRRNQFYNSLDYISKSENDSIPIEIPELKTKIEGTWEKGKLTIGEINSDVIIFKNGKFTFYKKNPKNYQLEHEGFIEMSGDYHIDDNFLVVSINKQKFKISGFFLEHTNIDSIDDLVGSSYVEDNSEYQIKIPIVNIRKYKFNDYFGFQEVLKITLLFPYPMTFYKGYKY